MLSKRYQRLTALLLPLPAPVRCRALAPASGDPLPVDAGLGNLFVSLAFPFPLLQRDLDNPVEYGRLTGDTAGDLSISMTHLVCCCFAVADLRDLGFGA